MRVKRKLTHAAVACAVTSGMLVVGTGGTAFAGGAPEYTYAFSHKSVYDYNMVPASSAPPGHTLSIQLTAGLSVTATIGGEVSGEASAIVAGLKASVNASVAMTLTASVTYGDSWKVPAGVTRGYLHAGAERQKADWVYERLTPACAWQTVRSGTANVPFHIPAFWSTTT